MEYNYYLTYQKEIEHDECILKGLCSQNPSLVFLHEVIISYLQELAFYLLNLKNLGISNEKVKEDFMEGISEIIINVEFSPEQFYKLLTKLYSDSLQAKEIYVSVCEKNNLKLEVFKSTIKNPKKFDLSDAIRQGQKFFNIKYKKFTPDQMRMYEAFLNLGKSLYIHLAELKGLGYDDEKAYKALLSLLSIANNATVFLQKMQELIKEFFEVDHSFLQKLYEIKKEKYGEIEPTEVSTSIRPGKAILVSGSDLKELELILEATKNKSIDIYTYGNMLSAHSYPKLKAYPHLVGHYGKETENYILDFSEFPGAIFLTKHSLQRVENLYRSRIFTTDVIAPKGVMTIINNNFEQLIESALHAEGFTETIENPPIKLNLSEKEILDKITNITQKIEDGEIKHSFIIGTSNRTKTQKEYFEKFFKLLGDDSFVLSFSNYNGGNNVLQIESDYKFPILYKSLEILTRKMSIKELNPVIFYTRCERHSISNLFYMKSIGINKIYFPDCPPNLVNPALIDFLRKEFNIKSYTSPENDLKNILEE